MKMVTLYKDPRGLTLFTKPGTITTQGLSRISHHPTITELGTVVVDEIMQEEVKEKAMSETNENTTHINGKPIEELAYVNTDVENQIASTVLSTTQKIFKDSSNGCVAQSNQEIEAQAEKTDDKTTTDTKTCTIRMSSKRKEVSWQPERKN